MTDPRSRGWLEWTLWARLLVARKTGAIAVCLGVPPDTPAVMPRPNTDAWLEQLRKDMSLGGVRYAEGCGHALVGSLEDPFE